MEIKWNSQKASLSDLRSRFHYVWLRDNCQCPECYHPVTNQRLVDVVNIGDNLRPSRMELTEHAAGAVSNDSAALTVDWEDDHTSMYSLSWLQSHCYDWHGEAPHSMGQNPLVSRVDPAPWGREISDTPPIVNYNGFMKDDQTFLEWSDKVDKHGFCFIDGIPLEPSYTKQVLERIGVLRNTMYGEIWDVEMNSKPDKELEVG